MLFPTGWLSSSGVDEFVLWKQVPVAEVPLIAALDGNEALGANVAVELS